MCLPSRWLPVLQEVCQVYLSFDYVEFYFFLSFSYSLFLSCLDVQHQDHVNLCGTKNHVCHVCGLGVSFSRLPSHLPSPLSPRYLSPSIPLSLPSLPLSLPSLPLSLPQSPSPSLPPLSPLSFLMNFCRW